MGVPHGLVKAPRTRSHFGVGTVQGRASRTEP